MKMYKGGYIIDHDGGIDDALAIMCALHASKKTNNKIIGITTVSGNVSNTQSALNTLRILDTFDVKENIPIYTGCSEAIIKKDRQPWPGHGTDGLGNAYFERSIDPSSLTNKTHAAVALIEMIRSNRGCHIVALGPLTNIAMALKLDPDIKNFVGQIVIMGGSLHGKGNSSLAAEFNFHSDPESAHIVISSFDSATLTLVTWDLTEDYSLSWDQFDELVKINTKASMFMHSICQKYEHLVRPMKDESESNRKKQKLIESNFVPCDLYAMAVAFYPNFIVDREYHFGQVEINGSFKGYLGIDWYDQLKKPKNICAVTKLEKNCVYELLFKILNEL